MAFSSSNIQFKDRIKRGHKSEQVFMKYMASVGGTSMAIGPIPALGDPTPRFYMPHELSEDGVTTAVSPDVVFTIPGQTYGMANLAQVKRKSIRLEGRGDLAWEYMFLDEREWHRLRVANMFYIVYFVACIPDPDDPDDSIFLYVSVSDLLPENNTFLKRTVKDTKTFLIPLQLFQPIENLLKEDPIGGLIKSPANVNGNPQCS